jgi:hypothetical protein
MVSALKAGDANVAADAIEDLIDALRREAIRRLQVADAAFDPLTPTKDGSS